MDLIVRLSAQLRASNERYELALKSSRDGLWHWDLALNRVDFSPRWQDMMGLAGVTLGTSIEEWLGRVHPDDVDRVRSVVLRACEGEASQFDDEHRVLHSDGSYRFVAVRGAASADGSGRALRMVGSLTDVTGRRRAEQQLLYETYHDTVTFLPNRSLLLTLLEKLVAEPHRRSQGDLAVLSIGVDRFKTVNQALGQSAGDQLLNILARRLENCLRDGDAVARSGDDEFVVVLASTMDLATVLRVAARIQGEIGKPLALRGQDVLTTCCVGIAMIDPTYERAGDLLRDADIAMYRAKALGRGRHVVYQPAMHEHSARLIDLASSLRHAIERRELRVFYQPIVSLGRGRITGLEALVRWEHPTRGFISPDMIISLAEDNGLINQLGEFMLEEAVRQVSDWRQTLALATPLTLSVNISAKQLASAGLVEHVERVLSRFPLDPASLHLEVTESSVMENPESAEAVLQHLKSLKVEVHLDDFGTGHSSLSHLMRLGVDCVKIDRSFVTHMEGTSKNAAIVHAATTLARALGIRVIAEGIETADHLRQLRDMQCDYGQGFLFAKALPADEAAKFLASEPSW